MVRFYSDEELKQYKDKPATVVQDRYARWIIEKVGIEFPTKKAEGQFYDAVRLATALRMIFQASPENREERVKIWAQRDAAARALARVGPMKRGPKPRPRPEPEPEPVAEPEPAKPAAKRARKLAVVPEPVAEVAPVKRGRPRKAVAAAVVEAPKAKRGRKAAPPPVEFSEETVAPAARKSAPRKAKARSGAAAPF